MAPPAVYPKLTPKQSGTLVYEFGVAAIGAPTVGGPLFLANPPLVPGSWQIDCFADLAGFGLGQNLPIVERSLQRFGPRNPLGLAGDVDFCSSPTPKDANGIPLVASKPVDNTAPLDVTFGNNGLAPATDPALQAGIGGRSVGIPATSQPIAWWSGADFGIPAVDYAVHYSPALVPQTPPVPVRFLTGFVVTLLVGGQVPIVGRLYVRIDHSIVDWIRRFDASVPARGPV